MTDLSAEFAHLQPSALKRVLDSLEDKGLVGHAGDETLVYLNGVQWWSTALGAGAPEPNFARMAQEIESADLGIEFNADPNEGRMTLFVPLVELEGEMQGLPSSTLDRLRNTIQRLEQDQTPVRLTIAAISPNPEPTVIVKLTPLGFGA